MCPFRNESRAGSSFLRSSGFAAADDSIHGYLSRYLVTRRDNYIACSI